MKKRLTHKYIRDIIQAELVFMIVA